MIEKLISGGQSGSDSGGLQAAKRYGIATGGWISLGCMTENGPNPSLKRIYGLQETNDKSYPSRTFKNVETSDGTIRFAIDFQSPGELCTLKAINKYKKPYLSINIKELPEPKDVVKWLLDNNIKILNVAGNKESTSPGITEIVRDFLLEVFKITNPETKITRKDSGFKHPYRTIGIDGKDIYD